MSDNTDFGVLGSLLQNVQYGVTLLMGNTKIYSNSKSEELFNEFPDLLNEILSYTKLRSQMIVDGRLCADFKNEFHLLDCNKCERYIDIEIVNMRKTKLITLVDNTERRLSGLIDELTRLGNRAMFEQKLNSLSYKECTYPISIIEGDLNGLKLVNDVFGHAIGDELIIEMAKILKNCVRGATDTVCRWGGDEFAIILPHAPEHIAREVCERYHYAL